MKASKVLKYIGFGILGFAFCVLVIFGVQALWNWLIPELFHGPVLTYWQTVGLFLLSKILLTGVAPGQHQSPQKKDWRKKYGDKFNKPAQEDQNVVITDQV